MRIGFLSHLDLNLYLFRLSIMKELVKRGCEVYAIAPKGEFFKEFEKFNIKAVDYKINRASLNPIEELKTIKNIKETVGNLNLDILHSFMHKPNIYGSFANSKNFVQTVTGLGSFFIHNDLKSKIIREMIILGYKLSSKNAKKVIFQNRDDLKFFVNKNIISKDKAVLIKSSGIDTKEFSPMPKNRNLLKQLYIDNKKPVVLMIARVIKDKGVEEFIKAAEILKDKATFLYVGDIDRGNKNAFSPDWRNVKYLGFRRDIKELISVCDIFVLPSYREGVPRTLLEAASMGKPIVTTDTPGCREVVDDGFNGFLVPLKNSIILAEKIERLIKDDKLRERFGYNSREKALKEFDIEIVVNKYIKVYEEILGV